MSLTPTELRLAADAAERWPVNPRRTIKQHTTFENWGDRDQKQWHVENGSPAMVLWASSNYRKSMGWWHKRLDAVYPAYDRHIDAGRGKEVAAAFRARADEIEREGGR